MSPAPLTTIGSDDDRADYLLGHVADVLKMDDGTLVIADQQSSDVRRFAGDGEFLGTLLTRGEGPGEVLGPSDFVRLQDGSLGVLTLRPGFLAISSEGQVLDQSPFNVWEARFPCRMADGEGGHLLPTSNVLFVWEDHPGREGCPTRPQGNWRQEAVIGIVDRETNALDTVDIVAATERSDDKYRVFGSALAFAVGHDLIWTGDTEAGTIRAYDFEGDSDISFEVPFPARSLRVSPAWPSERTYKNEDGVVQSLGTYDFPEHLPRFSRLVPDPAGYVWIGEYPEPSEPFDSFQTYTLWGAVGLEDGVRWLVLDRSGRQVAEVVTPPNFFLSQVGPDFVVGISIDEFDVHSVHVHELVRTASLEVQN